MKNARYSLLRQDQFGYRWWQWLAVAVALPLLFALAMAVK